jgi:hypothetical protein
MLLMSQQFKLGVVKKNPPGSGSSVSTRVLVDNPPNKSQLSKTSFGIVTRQEIPNYLVTLTTTPVTAPPIAFLPREPLFVTSPVTALAAAPTAAS